MAEYIEREAMLENLKRQYGEDLGWQCTVNMSDVGMMIEDASAADVVEVVRCKDCRRWVPDGGYGLDLDGTKRLYGKCGVTGFSHKENHFCGYGAKMDGKGEGE